MAFKLVQARIDFPVIQRLGTLTNRFEQQRLRVELRVNAENVQNNSGRRTIVTTTDDIAIANDENQLAFVIIIESSKRINRAAQRVLSFCVTRHLTQDELVLKFRVAFTTELQRSND